MLDLANDQSEPSNAEAIDSHLILQESASYGFLVVVLWLRFILCRTAIRPPGSDILDISSTLSAVSEASTYLQYEVSLNNAHLPKYHLLKHLKEKRHRAVV